MDDLNDNHWNNFEILDDMIRNLLFDVECYDVDNVDCTDDDDLDNIYRNSMMNSMVMTKKKRNQ